MNNFYYIYNPLNINGLYKKYNYNQYITAAQKGAAGSFWKVSKTDFNTLEKALKGVIVSDKVKVIFNRLAAAGKAARAY